MIQFIRNILARRTFAYKARNKAMNMFSSYENFKAIRETQETKRQKENRPHEVLYFHKVDDPYSHLTIQYIDKFINGYDINLKPILVGEENPVTVHEPDLYDAYCLQDVKRIAPFYNVDFEALSYPSKDLVSLANSILCNLEAELFTSIAKEVSSALWQGQEEKLKELNKIYKASDSEIRNKLNEGNEIRNDCDYYFGSAFYYEKELYWGVDRLNHLETRLAELGAKKTTDNDFICNLNTIAPNELSSEDNPYTFVSAKKVKDLVKDYPINLITKPVLPMLMRMMVIPTFKAKYIISDAAREGRKYGYELKSI